MSERKNNKGRHSSPPGMATPANQRPLESAHLSPVAFVGAPQQISRRSPNKCRQAVAQHGDMKVSSPCHTPARWVSRVSGISQNGTCVAHLFSPSPVSCHRRGSLFMYVAVFVCISLAFAVTISGC